jgi:hypothetical protein
MRSGKILDATPERGTRCSASPCGKPDSHTSLTEYHFIIRLKSDAACTPEDRNGSARAHDLGSVFATIIVQPEVPGERLVFDVGMLS